MKRENSPSTPVATAFCARCTLPREKWANFRGYRIEETTYCCVGCGDRSGCICQQRGEPPRLNIVLDGSVEPNLQPATILLVDDKPANLLALEAVLNSASYRILSASSGLEALEVLEKEDVALILLDIQMPGMDGLETARKIKAKQRTKDIPIIFITAIYRDDPNIRLGYAAGAVDYFGKPFDIEVLQRKVGIYTKLYQQSTELRDKHDQQVKLIELLRRRNEELEHNFAERAAVLEGVSEAVAVSRGRRISDFNRAALELLGFGSQDDINRDLASFSTSINVRDAKTGRALTVEEQPYFRALCGERTTDRLIIRNAKTGIDHVIHSMASPVFFRNQVIGVVWSISKN